MMSESSTQPEMNFTHEQVIQNAPDPETSAKGRQKRQKSADIEGKQVEKIVYFFKDKTFLEYYPE